LEDTLLGDEPARARKEVREAPNTHTCAHAETQKSTQKLAPTDTHTHAQTHAQT
jgi:hypothetical protein